MNFFLSNKFAFCEYVHVYSVVLKVWPVKNLQIKCSSMFPAVYNCSLMFEPSQFVFCAHCCPKKIFYVSDRLHLFSHLLSLHKVVSCVQSCSSMFPSVSNCSCMCWAFSSGILCFRPSTAVWTASSSLSNLQHPTLQFRILHYTIDQYRSVQYSTLQYTTVQNTALHYRAVWRSACKTVWQIIVYSLGYSTMYYGVA